MNKDTLAPWRSPLARALHRNRALVYSRYLQLATVQPDGCPANRTVVFRGFVDDTNHLIFITDARSNKIADIQHHPYGAICWYFAKTREQFRLSGTLILVTANSVDADLSKARHGLWRQLSDAARVQFAWSDPGQPRQNEDDFAPPPPDSSEPLANFCLLLLEPMKVDHLELRGEPQNRYRYSQAGDRQWLVQSINP